MCLSHVRELSSDRRASLDPDGLNMPDSFFRDARYMAYFLLLADLWPRPHATTASYQSHITDGLCSTVHVDSVHICMRREIDAPVVPCNVTLRPYACACMHFRLLSKVSASTSLPLNTPPTAISLRRALLSPTPQSLDAWKLSKNSLTL